MKQTSTSFSTELLFFVIFTRFWQGEALMDGNMVTDFHTIWDPQLMGDSHFLCKRNWRRYSGKLAVISSNISSLFPTFYSFGFLSNITWTFYRERLFSISLATQNQSPFVLWDQHVADCTNCRYMIPYGLSIATILAFMNIMLIPKLAPQNHIGISTSDCCINTAGCWGYGKVNWYKILGGSSMQ